MLLYSIILYLSSISVAIRRDVSIHYSRSAMIILITCIMTLTINTDLTLLGKGLALYGGLFFVTPLTQIFKIFILILSSIILLFTSYYPRKYINPVKNYIESSVNKELFSNEESSIDEGKPFIDEKDKINKDKKEKRLTPTSFFNKTSEQFRILEYSLIILFVLTGAVFLLSTSDWVSVFLAIELQSYGLYLLCSMYKNSELATSSGLTYFLLGGLASCFILLGIAILYANSGNTNLDGLYVITNVSNILDDNFNTFYWYKPIYIYFGFLILSVGFLFKISAAPFHFWSPDVYDDVPTIVTSFIAIIPKISILVFILELVHYTGNISKDTGLTWTSSLLLSSLLSLVIGTILGLTQSRIKRLLAYSTISHLGFILLALSVNSIESNQSFIFYLIQYSITNLNAFVILLSMGYALYFCVNDSVEFNKLSDKNNSPIQLTNQIKGYYYLNPFLALSFAITLFSFIGIPPLIGFFGKQMVLSSALDKGYVFIVLIAILTSVISAVYYLVIIKKMYFDNHEYKIFSDIKSLIMDKITDRYNVTVSVLVDINYIKLSNYLTISISIITLTILSYILVPQTFMNLSNILSLGLHLGA